MPIVPLFGHTALRERLRDAIGRGALPASVLLHGPPGVGKQRLALWVGQTLLCTGATPPCGECQHCRYALELRHPDLHWFFPRPRLKDADATAAEVREDYADALADRAKANGLYAPPSGTEGVYVSTVRAIVQLAAVSPAMARRKVFVIGDAERMVPQEGADMAANAFLKLLEEPLEDTTILLTSSEPGALLPTIRSRVVAVRVPRLPDEDVAAFVADPAVAAALDAQGLPKAPDERRRLANGAPGTLLGGEERAQAIARARRMLDAATRGGRAARLRLAFSQKPAGARGDFTDMLDALVTLLHERTEDAVRGQNARAALAATRAVECVERAKGQAAGNINPQLVSAALLRSLSEQLA